MNLKMCRWCKLIFFYFVHDSSSSSPFSPDSFALLFISSAEARHAEIRRPPVANAAHPRELSAHVPAPLRPGLGAKKQTAPKRATKRKDNSPVRPYLAPAFPPHPPSQPHDARAEKLFVFLSCAIFLLPMSCDVISESGQCEWDLRSGYSHLMQTRL